MRSTALETQAARIADAGVQMLRSAGPLPPLEPSIRAINRLAATLARPMRLAMMGESNSGKSTIVNVLLGDATLPALPYANTRVATLLRYADQPGIHVRNADGHMTELRNSGSFDAQNAVRIEVSLPLQRLRSIEFIDFPGLANPAIGWAFHDSKWFQADGAVWATVATQAWRESERAAWQRLPGKIRRNSVLVVTHCDLVKSSGEFQALQQRLLPIAAELFQDIVFSAVQRGVEDAPAMHRTPLHRSLSGAIGRMQELYCEERSERAALIAGRIAGHALRRLEMMAGSQAALSGQDRRNWPSGGSGVSMSDSGKDDVARVKDVLQQLQTLGPQQSDAPAPPAGGNRAKPQLNGLDTLLAQKQASLSNIVPRNSQPPRRVAVYAIGLLLLAGVMASAMGVLPFWRSNAPPPPAVSKKDADLAKILSDGRAQLVKGDIAAARETLKRAASEKAEIAFLLAQSYDPNFLQSLPKTNAQPDRVEAERWYREWYDLAGRSGLSLDQARLQRIINAMRP